MSSNMLRSLKLASSILQLQSSRSCGVVVSPIHQILQNYQQQTRSISTTKKNSDVTITSDGVGKGEEDKPKADDFSYEAAKKV